ncbi:uncharacterized protein LOC143169782 isoform X3 [Aptenodytes patagonicus]|uniref:uncharacterized protein LOC143169782 isoform X3 n=1 Tax=Aptenodytes patagonicus TaxID=9234 RepID=UPI003F9F5F8A
MQGLRGRKQSRAFQPGFPWRLWLQRQLPAEVSAVPSNQSHPGMEGDPGLLDVSERSRPMACLPDRPEGPNRGEAVTWSTWVSFGGDCQMFGVSRVGPRQS